ncbi:MAG: hypothetical protein HEQ12_01020 [Aphanizomenon flos-aquae DEX188]|nr:MAG: hypothetical protein HEQ12_01020 [Aphanizomenon flos-aquae DEX188]
MNLGDSEALRRNRFWECGECDSEARPRNRCLGMLGCDRFLGCGSAIAKRDLGIAVLGCGGAIAKRDLGIAFGVWECDRCISKHLTYQLI